MIDIAERVMLLLLCFLLKDASMRSLMHDIIQHVLQTHNNKLNAKGHFAPAYVGVAQLISPTCPGVPPKENYRGLRMCPVMGTMKKFR